MVPYVLYCFFLEEMLWCLTSNVHPLAQSHLHVGAGAKDRLLTGKTSAWYLQRRGMYLKESESPRQCQGQDSYHDCTGRFVSLSICLLSLNTGMTGVGQKIVSGLEVAGRTNGYYSLILIVSEIVGSAHKVRRNLNPSFLSNEKQRLGKQDARVPTP